MGLPALSPIPIQEVHGEHEGFETTCLAGGSGIQCTPRAGPSVTFRASIPGQSPGQVRDAPAPRARRCPLVETCQGFGFTRESYRHITERFRLEGMAGLFEKKRGRRQPLKLTESVRQWLEKAHEQAPNLGAEDLAQRLEEQSGVCLSRRSVAEGPLMSGTLAGVVSFEIPFLMSGALFAAAAFMVYAFVDDSRRDRPGLEGIH